MVVLVFLHFSEFVTDMSDTQLDLRSRVRITLHYTAAGDQLTVPRWGINWPIKLPVLRIWYWCEFLRNVDFILLLWKSKYFFQRYRKIEVGLYKEIFISWKFSTDSQNYAANYYLFDFISDWSSCRSVSQHIRRCNLTGTSKHFSLEYASFENRHDSLEKKSFPIL